MRVTRETLIKIARDTAAQRSRVSRRIVCIYLTGSLLGDSPMLGGTTDIDLVIIQDSEPVEPREVVHLTDEVSLDIAHYDQAAFRQPRHLRSDPWLGPYIYRKPLVLYDPQHWFDFTQAATGAQFFQPDYIVQRANTLAQAARQSWMDLEMHSATSANAASHPKRLYTYLETLENAGNALVCLTGEGNPLPERRFLLQLPQRLQAMHQPDLVSGLTNLVVEDPTRLETAWPEWKLAWKEAYGEVNRQDNAPVRLHPARQMYYDRAADALWEENPDAAVWLLLRTWTLAADRLPEGSPAFAAWQAACQVLNVDPEHFPARLQALDRYLDRVEETLETWARENGVSSASEA